MNTTFYRIYVKRPGHGINFHAYSSVFTPRVWTTAAATLATFAALLLSQQSGLTGLAGDMPSRAEAIHFIVACVANREISEQFFRRQERPSSRYV